MCEMLEAQTSGFVWVFLIATLMMALLSRKLNEHLLVPPEPPKHIWFRKKNHIKPSYLMKPDLYFDETGCRWAWRFTVFAAIASGIFLLLLYRMFACSP